MSFDLYFCPQSNAGPSITELKRYFSALPHFDTDDVEGDGHEFYYENDVTGVYCVFYYLPPHAGESDESGGSGLSFSLNFFRPSFFAYETMPLVEDFSRHFNLLVEDPQAETKGPANSADLIKSWRASEAKAFASMRDMPEDEKDELHFMPEPEATAWWRYTSIRQQLEDSIADDIFIPLIMVLMNPAKELFTAIVWPNAIPQFFPACDYVYVNRETNSGQQEEAGFVSYADVMREVEHLLDIYQFAGKEYRYLAPHRSADALPLIQRFQLKAVDLGQYQQMGADSFQDVAPS
jgi:hypothetical protein